MTIHQYVSHARARLEAAGIDHAEAELDARLLAQQSLGWDAAGFFVRGNEKAPAEFAASYEALTSRRIAREPMAYIRGEQEFWGRRFEISAAVLIPRPETEGIIETSLELCPDAGRPLRIADVGTGSGCLAVTLAIERPRAFVTATDISAEALAVAARNAAKHGISQRVTLARADLFAGAGVFDLIVSNPPYVPDRDRAALQPEVRDYEPPAALFAGDDGLAVIERLLLEAAGHLAPGGHLVFEFGYGQADAVSNLIARASGLALVAIRRDLQKIPRIAVLQASQPALHDDD